MAFRNNADSISFMANSGTIADLDKVAEVPNIPFAEIVASRNPAVVAQSAPVNANEPQVEQAIEPIVEPVQQATQAPIVEQPTIVESAQSFENDFDIDFKEIAAELSTSEIETETKPNAPEAETSFEDIAAELTDKVTENKNENYVSTNFTFSEEKREERKNNEIA